MAMMRDDPATFDPNIVGCIAPVAVAMWAMMAHADRGVVVAVAIKSISDDESADYATENRETFVTRFSGLGRDHHRGGGKE